MNLKPLRNELIAADLSKTDTRNLSEIVTKVDCPEVSYLTLVGTCGDTRVSSRNVSVGQELTIGRSDHVDHRVPVDNRMSKLHFSIECQSNHAVVRDLGSTNGTFVNGQRVNRSVVTNGDYISAGSTIFLVQLSYSVEPKA